MISGRATPADTLAFANAAGGAEGHFRTVFDGIKLSSIGLGTYLGEEDVETDRGFEDSIAVGLASAVNVFDSALNYRGQRSERAVGRALRRALEAGLSRGSFFVSTKGGFLPHDAEDPRSPEDYVRSEYVDTGILAGEDIAAGCHALSPRFLAKAIEQSRRNLNVATIDLYYLHNPETQLQSVSRSEFQRRLRLAFEFLEEQVVAGTIARWGLATWDCLRVPPRHPAHVSLEECFGLAREVAGDSNHFHAIQAPVNLAMPQAVAFDSQSVKGRLRPLLDAARELGLAGFSSASILQGRLSDADLPPEVDELFSNVPAGARRALQFPRSAAGIAAALVGVSNPAHARETFGLSRIPPADSGRIRALFS
ncbi:MAG: aldo/keto reductase [Thermoanaerobaculia bacterium]